MDDDGSLYRGGLPACVMNLSQRLYENRVYMHLRKLQDEKTNLSLWQSKELEALQQADDLQTLLGEPHAKPFDPPFRSAPPKGLQGANMLPVGSLPTHFHSATRSRRCEYMPTQLAASHGSLFRKTSRFLGHEQPVPSGEHQPGDVVPTVDTASLTNSSSTGGTRPPTARARRDSSISSITDIGPSLRRRSTSLHGTTSDPSQVDKVAPSTSARDASRPSTAMAEYRASFVPSNAAVFQRIQDIATKRVSTLDYLKKAHDGRTYWFNTIFFNKPDLHKLSYFDQHKLARRAANFFMLGNSIPAVLDPNANNLTEYLRLMNALLTEFESYQTYHPLDGSNSSALPRVRMGQVFRRVTSGPSKSGRRASDLSSVASAASDNADGLATSTPATQPTFLGNDRELLPGEDYNYLLTPSLPFEPDYFETFSTLCDVLIDCYTTLLSLVTTPEEVGPGAAELFHKVDGKVKKLMIAGIVKEFEVASRQGVRSEMAGVGKVVLSGLA